MNHLFKFTLRKYSLNRLLPVFILMLPVQVAAEWVEWIADANLTVEITDNLNYSAFDNDSFDDTFSQFNIYGGRFYQIDGNARLWMNLSAEYRKHNKFDGLDGSKTGIDLGYRRKFGVGPSVSSLITSVHYHQFRPKAEAWQFDETRVVAKISKPLTSRLDANLGVSIHQRDGIDAPIINPLITERVFDQSFYRVNFSVNYLLTNYWLLNGDVSYRDGDFHSACTPANVAIVLDTENVEAITKDTVFGGCVYRLSGDGFSYDIGVVREINRHSSISLGYQYQQGKASVLDYDRESFNLSISYRY